jgi:hypothetical protein
MAWCFSCFEIVLFVLFSTKCGGADGFAPFRHILKVVIARHVLGGIRRLGSGLMALDIATRSLALSGFLQSLRVR